MKRSILIGLVSVAMLAGNARVGICQQSNSAAPPAVSKTTAHDDKIQNQVFKLGVGHDATVKLISGKEWHGRITSIEADNFKLMEVDLGQILLITYQETRKVYEGYTELNVFGKRISPHSRKISEIVTAAGLVGLLAFIASQAK